jgi:hypothetical protein
VFATRSLWAHFGASWVPDTLPRNVEGAVANSREYTYLHFPSGGEVTVIFKNNIVHKGNYCREGFRDVVMIGLRLPGKYPRAERILRRLWRRRP